MSVCDCHSCKATRVGGNLSKLTDTYLACKQVLRKTYCYNARIACSLETMWEHSPLICFCSSTRKSHTSCHHSSTELSQKLLWAIIGIVTLSFATVDSFRHLKGPVVTPIRTVLRDAIVVTACIKKLSVTV